MMDRFSTALREGMDVYDPDGDKVGKVGRVYHPAGATATPSTTSGTSTRPTGGTESYFKVDTGFLGLGKDLFIPTTAIRDVTGDRVILNIDKDRVDTMGWDRRPSWLPQD